jgi:hypothetical protein
VRHSGLVAEANCTSTSQRATIRHHLQEITSVLLPEAERFEGDLMFFYDRGH